MKQLRYVCQCVGLLAALSVSTMAYADHTVYIPNWGEIKTADTVQIVEGTPSSIMAKSIRNQFADWVSKAGMEKESYFLVLDRDKAYARFAIITEQTAGPIALKRLGLIENYPLLGMDDKELMDRAVQAMNKQFKTNPPAQYMLERPFTLSERKGKSYAEGVLSYGDIVNGAVHTERIYIIAYPKNGRIQICAVIGNSKDEDTVLKPLVEKIKDGK